MENMTELTKYFFVFFCLLESAYTRRIFEEQEVYFLNVGDRIVNDKPGLKIYCHDAEPKHIINIWKTMIIHLDINSKQYTLYHGKTPDEISEKYDKKDISFNFFGSISLLNGFKINPFKDICIGVYINSSNESRYIISMTETSISDWLFTMIIGILIFWYAQMLSQKSSFYYACGTLFGVIISIIILVYIILKFMKQFRYLIFAGSISVFLTHELFEKIQIRVRNGEWIMLYILISSLISFMICYRFGPVTNPRTKQITQWFLQIVGLVLIYTSSYLREVSFFCCVILILLYKLLKATPEQEIIHW